MMAIELNIRTDNIILYHLTDTSFNKYITIVFISFSIMEEQKIP